MMAYLGLSPDKSRPEPTVCTQDFLEYVNPSTGESSYGSSSCPPAGFVGVDKLYDPKKPLIDNPVRMTPQEIERYVRQGTETSQTGGALVLAALAAFFLLS